MARVVTSSIPTDTLFDIQTITSESTFFSRARVTQVTTITQEEVELDEDGDLVTVTDVVESDVVSISTSTGTRTYTLTSSIPVETLYSLSLSTSTLLPPSPSPTTTSLSLIRQPLPSTSSSTEDDEVVVVTQFTTITPVQATTSTPIPTLSPSSNTGRSAIFPNGGGRSSASNSAASAANDGNASSARSSSGSSLSSGAIAGIAIGAVAVAILLGILGFLFCCRQRRNNRRDSMYATTGGVSDEKLAPALFNPDYSHNNNNAGTGGARPIRTRSSGANSRQLLMANIGGAGTSSLSAGAAGVGAGVGSSSSNRRSQQQVQFGKNKPVPDVPPPVSSLQYMRPAPGQRTLSGDSVGYSDLSNNNNNIGYYAGAAPQTRGGVPYGAAAAAAAGMIGRPSSASPALATQGTRNAAGKRISAPTTSAFPSGPMQTPQEKAEALKRAKSVASVRSIPAEKLGKGAGYASPMPPIDPLGKPIDQKTWRERNSKIHSGEFWTPDTMLTPEQKLRRDSQIAKLQAARDGTASSKPNLGNLKEQAEPVETSPLLDQGDNSFEQQYASPERVSAMYTARNSLPNQSTAAKRPISTATILPYTAAMDANTNKDDNTRRPSSTSALPPPPPPRSPSPNGIYPSLPPNSPSRNAALSQSTQVPSTQPRYAIHQPLAQSHSPVRASFISAPQSSVGAAIGGPPPAPSSQQALNNRLPAIPGSRPSSMITSNTPLPEYRRSSTASFGNNASTPYAAAATSSQSPLGTPLFQHHNGSNGSFGTSRSGPHQAQGSTSIADEVFGGLTKGLSDRDLLRLSQPLQSPTRK